jgi:hypothetical protein
MPRVVRHAFQKGLGASEQTELGGRRLAYHDEARSIQPAAVQRRRQRDVARKQPRTESVA